jgi:hypothetical protein
VFQHQLATFLEKVRRLEKDIHVRSLCDGHWQRIPLADLNPSVWAVCVASWFMRDEVPDLVEVLPGITAPQ